jgi:hypothetical protein
MFHAYSFLINPWKLTKPLRKLIISQLLDGLRLMQTLTRAIVVYGA